MPKATRTKKTLRQDDDEYRKASKKAPKKASKKAAASSSETQCFSQLKRAEAISLFKFRWKQLHYRNLRGYLKHALFVIGTTPEHRKFEGFLNYERSLYRYSDYGIIEMALEERIIHPIFAHLILKKVNFYMDQYVITDAEKIHIRETVHDSQEDRSD